ncbi:SufE family protein [Pokkaliibacter sp. MBI-7]|uniref:SufE family protein n=1 Tax=Pokkaliibacter sp. MBI-7 TaxID=3040600 RepID=UPI00244D1B03|nr:SufE family protein [Pokkaliibacter sp. MBI-7]MDH2435747.1 SufE family protein [Pokkaliibacter sp. MBI-7]
MQQVITFPELVTIMEQHPISISSRDDVLGGVYAAQGWEGRYRELMRLGRDLPALPEELYEYSCSVKGCESEVRLLLGITPEGGFWCWAHSEARIISGLIALLLGQVNGLSAAQVCGLHLEAEMEELGLMRHLSPSRGNGLKAIINAIQSHACCLSQQA